MYIVNDRKSPLLKLFVYLQHSLGRVCLLAEHISHLYVLLFAIVHMYVISHSLTGIFVVFIIFSSGRTKLNILIERTNSTTSTNF